MNLPDEFSIAQMRRDELSVLFDWAAEEGWNPGLNDPDIAWGAAPESFIALRQGDALAGGGSIITYGARFGFMGLFLMRRDMRGRGLGRALWHWRRDTLLGRLEPGATIAMDGVFDMVPFYERGGFVPAFRGLRYEGRSPGGAAGRAEPLGPGDFDAIARYDRSISPAPRDAFLRGWVGQPGAHVLGLREGGAVTAYGVARPCRAGFKIGPLFADSPERAAAVFGALLGRIAGEPVQIDIPEPNAPAIDLARAAGFSMSFGCQRLYHGPDPALPLARIFGVTSFEFG